MSCPIRIEKVTVGKEKPDERDLGFGRYFTDHMFIMDYTEQQGWHDPRIMPYGPLMLDPASIVFHYAQAVFEGLKAYSTRDGRVLLFRPDRNVERLNRSNDRMDIPPVDPDVALDAIKTLVSVDRDWVPAAGGTSLYIRPFIIATEPHIGLKTSSRFQFLIILSPVGAYYPEGMNPVRIHVETQYVRAVQGGTGSAKAAGNYAGTLKAQTEAQKKGYAQVLWLDALERKYAEEVGSMNVFFKISGKVLTPALSGSILPGVTRESAITLLRRWGVDVLEEKVSIREVFQAQADGTLEEAFGTGTAAVISPIGGLDWNASFVEVNGGKTGPLTQRLYNTITGIQYGILEDPFGWMVQVN